MPAAILIFLLSLAVYSINLERPPHPDELYHMLAARGLLATGEPTIGEAGRYWRGFPLTWIVAQSLDLLGDSLTAGRLPSVVVTALLVALLFVFLHGEVGARAAWLGAGLFALSPFAIGLAQFVRFYSLQCFAFFIAAWLFYVMLRPPWRIGRIVAAGLAAVPFLAVALYFQPTTLFGALGIGLWATGVVALPWLADPTVPGEHKRRVVLALAAAGFAGLLALWLSGVLALLWQEYRTTSLFNLAEADRFWYYHAWYVLFYPTLWTLSGFIAVLALIKAPRLTFFLLAVFVVGFLLNSFAARKSMRYIAYAQPFLFALWGIGIASLWTLVADAVSRLRRTMATEGFSLLPPRLAGRATTTLLALALLVTVLANPAWLRSLTQVADITVPPELPPTRWDAAAPALTPWLEQVDAVVTTSDLGMLYYYGRADYLLSASKLDELPADDRRAFGRDFRTDVPVIDDPASLEQIIDCHASGLFIVESKNWLGGGEPRADVRRVIELVLARTEPIELPRRSNLKAFVWQHAPLDDCAIPPAARPSAERPAAP